MSNKRNKGTRWGVLIFAFSMAFIMVASLASGYLFNLANQIAFTRQQQAAARPTVVPTFEPPVSTAQIAFDRNALQANGLFSLGIPEPPEWGAIESSYDSFTNRARLLLRGELNVIEASVESPTQPVASAADLETVFTEQTLASSWRNYTNWRETQRTTVSRNGREFLQMDFELDFQDRTYVARQAAWVEEGRVYSVRVITPSNATDLLVFLLESATDNLTVVERFANTPVAWSSYFDGTENYIVRYPQDWRVTDSGEGLPTTIEGIDAVMRLESINGASADSEDAAIEFVSGLPGVNEVTSVVAVEREDLSGFSVAYNFSTLEGPGGSGVVVLLNAEESLYVANLRAENIDADLNESSDDTQITEYTQIAQTFSPIYGVEYAETSFGSAAPLVEQPGQQPGNINPGGF
ncbi:MAG: hypothetical protein AAF787_02100 [Chloroflexota bacterium]